jgi:hypothetical protein
MSYEELQNLQQLQKKSDRLYSVSLRFVHLYLMYYVDQIQSIEVTFKEQGISIIRIDEGVVKCINILGSEAVKIIQDQNNLQRKDAHAITDLYLEAFPNLYKGLSVDDFCDVLCADYNKHTEKDIMVKSLDNLVRLKDNSPQVKLLDLEELLTWHTSVEMWIQAQEAKYSCSFVEAKVYYYPGFSSFKGQFFVILIPLVASILV